MKNKDSGSIVVTVILVSLIVGLCGYVAYDKLVNSKPKAQDGASITQNSETVSNIKTYKSYSAGDKITFANQSWHTLINSDTSTDYVTALKDESIPELDGKPFYECPKADDNGINCSMKMSNDYQKSAPKSYFDNTYINTIGKNNLKNVDDYYIRLPKVEELMQLGCSKIDNLSGTCKNAPNWLASKDISWTMSTVNGSTTDKADDAFVWSFGLGISGYDVQTSGVGSTLDVRPVIFLLKSSIK